MVWCSLKSSKGCKAVGLVQGQHPMAQKSELRKETKALSVPPVSADIIGFQAVILD